MSFITLNLAPVLKMLRSLLRRHSVLGDTVDALKGKGGPWLRSQALSCCPSELKEALWGSRELRCILVFLSLHSKQPRLWGLMFVAPALAAASLGTCRSGQRSGAMPACPAGSKSRGCLFLSVQTLAGGLKAPPRCGSREPNAGRRTRYALQPG